MQKRLIRFLLLLAGGTLFAVDGANVGLASCQSRAALTAINFCFVFDCSSGAFGGLIEFCDVNGAGANIFDDCP